MMSKDKDKEPTAAAPSPRSPTIEEHARELGTPAWVLAGVKIRQAWPDEKRVPKAQFEKAVKDFLSGPTGKVKHG
jgi:hypothetical protein